MDSERKRTFCTNYVLNSKDFKFENNDVNIVVESLILAQNERWRRA